jgi:hypothetical protein
MTIPFSVKPLFNQTGLFFYFPIFVYLPNFQKCTNNVCSVSCSSFARELVFFLFCKTQQKCHTPESFLTHFWPEKKIAFFLENIRK